MTLDEWLESTNCEEITMGYDTYYGMKVFRSDYIGCPIRQITNERW